MASVFTSDKLQSHNKQRLQIHTRSNIAVAKSIGDSTCFLQVTQFLHNIKEEQLL